jgi:hypothetical protein
MYCVRFLTHAVVVEASSSIVSRFETSTKRALRSDSGFARHLAVTWGVEDVVCGH